MSVNEAPPRARGWRAVFARFRGKGGAHASVPATETANGHVKVVAPEGAEPETVAATPVATPEPEATVAEIPVADAPEATVAEIPVADAPVAEIPVAEIPVADAPVAEIPVADAPVAEVPAAGAPAGEAAALPLPNYDALTVASLRARLRNLDPAQLAVLIAYEKAHQGRDEVVGMFERRVAKINAGETASFKAIS